MLPKAKNLIPLLIVGVVSSLIFLSNLGRNTLADWDEAWYADASRYMFRHDHYVTPIWNNQYFFDKPPLQYWITQPFLWIFGETELSYRLPSALASIGVVIITFVWGKKQHGTVLGLAASAILLSFPHFLDRGRSGNFDGLFIFFTTLSLFLFMEKRVTLAGIVLGFSWMTKGVFSGFFLIVVIGLFLLYERIKNGTWTLCRPLIIYALVATTLYAPWHLLQITRFREIIQNSYFATFDQGEFGDWSWTSVVWRFDLRYFVFLWTFLRWWFPVLLIALVWKFFQLDRTIHAKQESDTWTFTNRFLPFSVFVIVFLALSAALQKNDWYIMPAYPFIALMITDCAHWIFPRRKLLLLAVILSLSISNLLSHWSQAFPKDKWLPERRVAEYVKSLTQEDDLVVTAEYEFPTLRYYSGREVRTAAPQQDLQGKYWWVWDAKDMEGAFQRGRRIITIHRSGTEWLLDLPGYHREQIGEVNDRIISRLVKR